MLFELTKKICGAYGPSGREKTVAKIIEDEIKDYVDEVYYDNLGNLIAHKKGTGKKVMTSAHMDSIGFAVSYVEENGFLRFANVGGTPPPYIINIPVRFENGVCGVVSYEDKKELSELTFAALSSFYIDIGAKDREDALSKISIGDFAVYNNPYYKQDDVVFGPYMDDRIACVAQIIAIKEAIPTDNDVYYVFSVQEEVGIRGATVASYHINPDFGIAVDVTFTGDTPNTKHKMEVKLGKGACVKIMDSSVICSEVVTDILYKASEELGITVQNEILKGGGTDTSAIQRSRGGTLVGAISIPNRYMHSPCEMVSLSDVEDTSKLLAKAITMFK